MMTQRLRVGWRGCLLRREFRHWLVFPADFRRNVGELYRARFNSDFDALYIAGLVWTRGISSAGQKQDLRTLKILQLWTESWKTCFFSVLASVMLWYQFVVHTGPKANTNKTQTSRFTWFPKTGYIHGGNKLYINGGMIQTLNSTQYNPQKPVFHSYTLFSQIYTCIHSHSCIHLHSPLHSLCLLSSLFYLLFSVFHTRLHEKGKHKYNGWKTEGGWKGEGGWWLLRKMLTICKCRQFATHTTYYDTI
jgi:hypothetical protein